jgi:O-antigen ligase
MLPNGQTAPRNSEPPYLQFGLALLLGLGAAAIAVLAAGLERKFVAGLVVAAPLGLMVLMLRTQTRFIALLVAVLAFTLSMNLDLTVMWRRHVGSSAGVQISAGLLCAMGLWTLWGISSVMHRRMAQLRLNYWQVGAIVAYMTCGILSLANAAFPELVGLEILRMTMLLLICTAVMNLPSVKHLKVFMFALSLAVVAQALLAYAQHLTGKSLGLQVFGEYDQLSQNIGYQFVRPTGTGGHPNILAYFLELATPVMLAMALTRQHRLLQAWYLLVTVAGVSALVLTLSRAAWLTIPISFSVVLGLLGLRYLLQLKTLIMLLLVTVLVAASGFYTFPIIYKRFMHDDYQSSSMRMPMNTAALSVIGQYPLLGVGMNNFSQVYRSYDKTTKSRVYTEDIYQGKHRVYVPFKHVVHNMYLMIWAEVGTIGLIAFLSIFVSTFLIAWRVYQRGPPWLAGAVVGIVAGLMGHMAHAMLDPGFPLVLNVSTMVFCYIGFVGAASQLSRDVWSGRPNPQRAARRRRRPPQKPPGDSIRSGAGVGTAS